MARIIMLICAVSALVLSRAETFSYRFSATPLPMAIQQIMETHPELDINFIYNELENYKTSATVNADDAYDAMRQTVGLNPVTVLKSKNTFYVEALQHGKYVYTGQIIGADKEPVAGAAVMLLAPNDSTVLTYGIADADGMFKIPCDRTNVIAKVSCLGYKTTYHKCTEFNVGTIIMPENALTLNEVMVEADNAQLYSDHSTFIPSKRQKNASQNATDLLRMMALPLVKVNPITNAVTDNAGNGVALYVNNLEASREDLNGMRMADVIRVEYLEFPTDPCFHGAPRVINFIMRQYEYGGYTKAILKENVLTGLSSHADLFSRFSFKRMTYDIYVAADNEKYHHTGRSTESKYNLMAADDTPMMLMRDETMENSNHQKNEYPITIGATYNSKKTRIRNKLGFKNSAVPEDEFSGLLEYNPAGNKDEKFRNWSNNHSNTLSYSGSFSFTLPKNFAINFTPQFNYTHINDQNGYQTSVNEFNQYAKENAIDYRGNLFLQKSFGKKHSLLFGASHGGNINRVNYEGSEQSKERFNLTFSSVLLGYGIRLKQVSLYADAGYSWETNHINNLHLNSSYPLAHINASWAPNQKHRLTLYFQLASLTPMLPMKTTTITQKNEVFYITGNPDLKQSRLTTVNFTYAWISSNKFSLSLNGQCESHFNRILAVYSLFNDGTAIKRTFTNDGTWIKGEIGMQASWKPFGGKLQLEANPRLVRYKSTGIYNESFNDFVFSVQATYYVKSLYFQALYESREKVMDAELPAYSLNRNFYNLTMGWSNSALNIRVGINNIFNKGWKTGVMSTISPYFSEHTVTYGTSFHPRINISLTYTIGYGKKIKAGNEDREQSSAASAILK